MEMNNASAEIVIITDEFIGPSENAPVGSGTDLVASKRIIHTVEQSRLTSTGKILKECNRILLPVYRSTAPVMYACERAEAERKVADFAKDTKAYSTMFKFKEYDQQAGRLCFEFLFQQFKTVLDDLYERKCINGVQYSFFMMFQCDIRPDQLEFLPDINKSDIPFAPMRISHKKPSKDLHHYLYDLLVPFYNEATKQTTFSNSTDAMVALESYERDALLLPTTLFATIKIDGLCTLYPHRQMILFIERFLHEHVPSDRIPNLSHQTIIALVRFVILNQLLVFGNTLYRQNKGGSSNSPLFILFANLYLFYWQKDLAAVVRSKNEIFGRCFDQIFFTWNGSSSDLDRVLKATTWPSLTPFQVSSTCGTTVHYLDVEIRNDQGRLHTNVFHECPFEPYFLRGVPSQAPSTSMPTILIYAALSRAVRCCNHQNDFELETNYICSMFILNHFPPSFVDQCFNAFYREFQWTAPDSHARVSAYAELRQRIRDNDQRCCALVAKSTRRGQRRTPKLNKTVSFVSCTVDTPNFKKNLKRRWEGEPEQLSKLARHDSTTDG